MNIGILTSGGVDSSVAAALTKKAFPKANLKAFYLKIWLEDELSYLGDCPWEEDVKNAQDVCDQFDIPLEIVSLQKDYHDRVVAYTIHELKSGRTPSPDVLCNQFIKFGSFYDRYGQDLQLIASGHYAFVENTKEGPQLLKGVDAIKDQTYFLSQLSLSQLKRCYFPIGQMKKSEVRAAAAELNLINSNRPDSQGICFLGKIKYRDFVKHHLGEKQGEIIDVDSKKVIGQHKGFWFHTVGQRKGLGLGGGPWLVTDKNIQKNIIYVRHQSKNFKGFDAIEVDSLNIIGNVDPGTTVSVKLRHGPQTTACKSFNLSKDGKSAELKITTPDQGVAPGQFAVFYQTNRCLGSGIITKAHS